MFWPLLPAFLPRFIWRRLIQIKLNIEGESASDIEYQDKLVNKIRALEKELEESKKEKKRARAENVSLKNK